MPKGVYVRVPGALKKEPGELKPTDEIARHHLYAQYRQNSRTRGFKFDIPEDVFCRLISSNCESCGAPPYKIHVTQSGSRKDNRSCSCVFTGLDRIDNSIGYELSNVRPFCYFCNIAKHSNSDADFQEWVERLVQFRVSRKNFNG